MILVGHINEKIDKDRHLKGLLSQADPSPQSIPGAAIKSDIFEKSPKPDDAATLEIVFLSGLVHMYTDIFETAFFILV